MTDKVKKGLECCLDHVFCAGEGCPYYKVQSEYCDLMSDALALIQQLESDKRQLEGLCNHMNQLRDAAAGRASKMEERVHQLEAELKATKDEFDEYARQH